MLPVHLPGRLSSYRSICLLYVISIYIYIYLVYFPLALYLLSIDIYIYVRMYTDIYIYTICISKHQAIVLWIHPPQSTRGVDITPPVSFHSEAIHFHVRVMHRGVVLQHQKLRPRPQLNPHVFGHLPGIQP